MDCQILGYNLPLFKRIFLCISWICLVQLARSENTETNFIEHIFEKQEFLMDVEKLQKFSTCDYSLEPFKLSEEYSKYQRYLPVELYNIMCKEDVLSKPCYQCSERSHEYKCIQTYNTIQIPTLKHSQRIYTGCVCAYQRPNNTSPENFH